MHELMPMGSRLPSQPWDRHNYAVVTIPTKDIEDAFLTVRHESFGEGYTQGNKEGYQRGFKDGVAVQAPSSPPAVLLRALPDDELLPLAEEIIEVKAKDALGHGSEKHGWRRWGRVGTVFYRGMSKEGYEEFKRTGVVPHSHHANVMSTDIETAKHYASQHDEPGVIVRFRIHDEDTDHIEQDTVSEDDFRVSKSVRAKDMEIVTKAFPEPQLFIKDVHENVRSMSHHAHELSAQARISRGKGSYKAHKHAHMAHKMAARHSRETSEFSHSIGDKKSALHHGEKAHVHEAHAEFHKKERRRLAKDRHTESRAKKGLISFMFKKGIIPAIPTKETPLSQEANALVVKALAKRMKRRDWISAKTAVIMKDGYKGNHVSQAQACATAKRMWNKKSNRRKPPMEAKALPDWVWLMTGGIAVNAEELQYKNTDGAADGLNDQRRQEDMDKPFDPLTVPPIAVWKAEDGQVYVVDGHKRLDHAKRKGVPNIRGFFIKADSFKDAKEKGEKLNVKLGTKALPEGS